MFVPFFASIFSCADSESTKIPEVLEESFLTPKGEYALESEVLKTGVSKVSLSRLHIFAQTPEGVWFQGPNLGEPREFEGAFLHTGVVSSGETPIFFLEEGVHIWEEELRLSPLDQISSDIFLRGVPDSSGVWLQSESGFYRYRDDVLQRIEQNGEPISGPWAAGFEHDGMPALWFAAQGLHLLVETPSGHTVALSVDFDAVQLSVDRLNRLWALDSEGDLYLRDGEWSRFDLPEPVTQIFGNPDSLRTWIRMESETWLWDEEEFWSVNTGDADWLGVDSAGRLLVDSGGDLHRLTADRRTGIFGLPRTAVHASHELSLSPPFAEELEQVQVRQNGLLEELSGPPWQFLLDPVVLGQGPLSLVVDLRYSDGSRRVTEEIRQIDLGIPNWSDDIRPLAESRCVACHGGNTYTVLNTKGKWQENIEEILEQVSSGAMPQGSDPLSPDEIGAITLWRDGGFQ